MRDGSGDGDEAREHRVAARITLHCEADRPCALGVPGVGVASRRPVAARPGIRVVQRQQVGAGGRRDAVLNGDLEAAMPGDVGRFGVADLVVLGDVVPDDRARPAAARSGGGAGGHPLLVVLGEGDGHGHGRREEVTSPRAGSRIQPVDHRVTGRNLTPPVNAVQGRRTLSDFVPKEAQLVNAASRIGYAFPSIAHREGVATESPSRCSAAEDAAHMQRTSEHPTIAPEAADGLVAAALRAEAWAGEPFLREDEDPAVALAPETARRQALDEALAEIEQGFRKPSPSWRVRFGLMLGLERVLSERPPRLASGTELRRHQIDALAGMLTELIAANQRGFAPLNGNGTVPAEELVEAPEDAENGEPVADAEAELEPLDGPAPADPGAVRRFRFRHPTASGKTIAAAGFVEAARTLGVLILTHRRLLVSQFNRELGEEGYGDRITPAIERGRTPPRENPVTIQTYAWFARHVGDLSRDAYQLVICDEAHTALGEKTSAAIRSFPEPVYIGMTATEQLIAKQVSDVFPASVDDLPLQDAARRGLIAPLRCLRVPPAAAIHSVPIVGGDFEERALAAALDHTALNQAAASLYRDRFDSTPGIVYAAGVDHAYNLAQEFRAAGLKAEAVSGRTPPVKLAEILAAYERGEIDILINAMLLAEGWNSPRATVVMHLAPTASRRVYQQRIGRIMRMHPRKEAGVVVDFVQKGATHNDRVISLHGLLGADFYREGARVTP